VRVILDPENNASTDHLWQQNDRVTEYSGRRPNKRSARSIIRLLSTYWAAAALWVGLALGLALCYRGGSRPLIASGLLLFGGLALQRRDLALLFVPLTAPLFLVSAALPGSAAPAPPLPPHELALLVTAAAALLHAALRLRSAPERRALVAGLRGARTYLPHWVAAYAPELLFLTAGVGSLFFGAPEPEARRDALRAFRWFVAEPLLFIALVRLIAGEASALARAFVAGGAAVAIVGLIQYISYDLGGGPAALAVHGQFAGDAWRATSVYGNPNNLGLYLGRVWPLAAALALAARKSRAGRCWATLGYGICAVVCLGGILVSFSRGAWVGAGAALIVLALPVARRRLRSQLLAGLLVGGAALLLVGTLVFALRGGPAGGSSTVRLLFWRESLALLRQHPLGVGLDQFFYFHHPAYGRSLIDPTLAHTQERDARQPHNLLLELWLNLGPLGLLAFAGLLARGIHRARAGALAHGALAALAAALAHGMVDAFYFWPDLAIAFWLLIAFAFDKPPLANQSDGLSAQADRE
jgi:putative inorganic carbon (hco3(-)) transporter